MSKEAFLESIRSRAPDELAEAALGARAIHMFSCEDDYSSFRSRVGKLLKATVPVAVVGSGNWRYSLNPYKSFSEFHEMSDVDVAVIWEEAYLNLWAEMRRQHREFFYALSGEQRIDLRRLGENVYAGFISPAWIPNREAKRNYAYRLLLDRLSDKRVGFRKVKLMFFKDNVEAIDYYARGFRLARGKIA